MSIGPREEKIEGHAGADRTRENLKGVNTVLPVNYVRLRSIFRQYEMPSDK